MNNFYDLTHPSNTVFYYVRLISHFNPFFSSINQCKVGYVGDGLYCGKDSDLDGIPDYALSCTGPHCTKVCIWYRPSQLTVYEECHPQLINLLIFIIQDNCRDFPNPDQTDLDKDGEGDVCDNDMDGDGIPNNRVRTTLSCYFGDS